MPTVPSSSSTTSAETVLPGMTVPLPRRATSTTSSSLPTVRPPEAAPPPPSTTPTTATPSALSQMKAAVTQAPRAAAAAAAAALSVGVALVIVAFAPAPVEPPPPPPAKPIVIAPPESELTRLTRTINAHDGDVDGRDALFARAKLAFESGDLTTARNDLMRLLKRSDVDGVLRVEATALMQRTEAKRRQLTPPPVRRSPSKSKR